jgi:hypothetical protein
MSIILPEVLHGRETCFLKLREQQRLRVFEDRMLKRIFGWKRDEMKGELRICITGSFIICTLRQVKLEGPSRG